MMLVLGNQKDLKMEKDMMEDNLKKGSLTIRLDSKLLSKYKSHCELNGYDMSKRLRIFIESEIPIRYDTINIIDIIYEPTTEIEVVNILGVNFPSIKSTPRVFVIKTNDTISENVSFYFKSKKYKLEGVIVTKIEDNKILIECSKWIIEYI
jgi:hypothetical protein